jgi:uncharacterized membrane protein
MTIAMMYVATLVPFLVIDVIVVRNVMLPLFERNIGPLMAEETRLDVALGFYMIYVAGIVYFCVSPAVQGGDISIALINGMILGLLAYGTYEMTNMATLRGWSWSMVLIDTVWGMILTAGSAAAGFAIFRTFAS